MRRFAWAAVIGLVLAIALTIPTELQQPIKPWDAYQFGVVNGEMIAQWTVYLLVVPALLILTVAITNYRKLGLGRAISATVVTLLVTSIIIGVGVLALSVAKEALYPMAELPFAAQGSIRDDFIINAVGSCMKRQRAIPENSVLSDEVLNTFCSCFANSMADIVTREDVKNATSASNMAKVQTAYEMCR